MPSEKEPIFTKNFILFFIVNFFIGGIMFGLNTILAEYTSEFSPLPVLSGIAVGIMTGGAIITRLYAGTGMQKHSWKKLIMVSALLHLAACCLYFFTVNIVLLIAVRFIHGLTFGVLASATASVGLAQIPKSRFGEGAGYFMLAPALSMAVCPFICGLIMDYAGMFYEILYTVGSALVILACLYFAKIEKPKGASAKPADFKGLARFIEPKVLPVTLCIFIFGIGYSGIISFLREFGAEISLTVSWFFIVYAVFLIILRPIAGKIQDRYGDAVLVYPGIILQTASLALFAAFPNPFTLFFLAFGVAAGYGIMGSVILAIATRNATADRRTHVVSTYWICCDVGISFGPVLLGLIASAGFVPMYFAGAAITLFVFPLYYFAARKGKTAST